MCVFGRGIWYIIYFVRFYYNRVRQDTITTELVEIVSELLFASNNYF